MAIHKRDCDVELATTDSYWEKKQLFWTGFYDESVSWYCKFATLIAFGLSAPTELKLCNFWRTPQNGFNCAGAWDVSRRCTPEENFSAIWERLRRQYLPQFLFIPVTKRAPRETWEISSEALKISTDVPTPSQPYHVQLPGAPGVVDWCSKFLSFLSYTLDFIFQCVNYWLTLVIHASPVKILKRSAVTSICQKIITGLFLYFRYRHWNCPFENNEKSINVLLLHFRGLWCFFLLLFISFFALNS